MKNKGFTLIELLAVIVILAIIALIATPIITGIVANVKKGAAESSALGWIDAVEKNIMAILVQVHDADISELNGRKDISNFPNFSKGQQPDDGWVEFKNGQIVDYELEFGEYIVTPKDNNPSKAVAVKENSKYPSVVSGVVYSIANGGTHVGYPIDAGVDMGNKYVYSNANAVIPFNTEEECTNSAPSCTLKKFKTRNLDYKTSPDASWNFYLKFTLNNGIIEEIEACDKYNGQEFCLKRSEDGSKYEQNKELLLNTFGNDNCDSYPSGVYCNDSVYAHARAGGTVSVGGGNVCDVFSSGAAGCYGF